MKKIIGMVVLGLVSASASAEVYSSNSAERSSESPAEESSAKEQDWKQLGESMYGRVGGDRFGHDVAFSADGNRVAVGGTGNDQIDNGSNQAGNDAGCARIFEWSDGSWVQMGDDILGDSIGGFAGGSVALSADGSRVAVGATLDANSDAGWVKVFDWSDGSWVQAGSTILGEEKDDYAGGAVSLSADGNRVAIGAPDNSGNGRKAGHVRVFEWSDGCWTQMGSDIDGEAKGDQLGRSLSLSADGCRLAVNNNGDGENAGKINIFEWSGGGWQPLGKAIGGKAAGDFWGTEVVLSADGTHFAAGAKVKDGMGWVRVYEWSGGKWVQMGGDIGREAVEDDWGVSTALSSDGSRLAVGIPLDCSIGDRFGRVSLYEWSDDNWVQLGPDIYGEAAGDLAGWSVALSANGKRVAAGAIYNGGSGEVSGQVRVFEE